MATNLIQIKRSLTTANATSLANGELAYTANGDVLWIGSNGGIKAIGGGRTPGTLTANQALVANSTSGIDKIIAANAVVTTVTANGSVGTAGQLLTSNGTVAYWQNPANSSFTIAGDSGTDTFSTGGTLTFASANGLTTTVTNDQVTFSVDTGSTLTVNTTGIHVNSSNLVIATSQLTGDVALGTNTSGNYVATITAGNGISGSSTTEGGTPTIAVVAGTGGGLVSNSTGVFVTAGSGLVANATGVHVGSANGINVQADTVGLTTGSTLTVNATGAHVNTDLSLTSLTTSGSLQVGGNLTVLGDLLTINVATLAVEDSLIQLASNNTGSDLLDIGFFGNYEAGDAGTHEHTGLFRDASDSGIFKLFFGLEETPTTTVNTAGTGYDTGTLQAFLKSGGLVSNSTAVTLTANSTLAVNLTANSITLTTPLAATSGGLGYNTYTSGDILVANTGNTLSKMALGASGYILMSNGTALTYDTLDGGTF